MNIQISVVIWTLICFMLLYVILKNLLFKPVLAVMDRRQAKTEAAKQAKAESERQLEQIRLCKLAEREAEVTNRQESVKAEAEKIRLEGKKLLEDAKEMRIRTVEQYRAEMDAEYDTDLKTAADNMTAVADNFLSHLFAD